MIYADYNATTPLGAGAIQAMNRAFEFWGNPSSAHRIGRQANELLESSRRQVAEKAGFLPRDVVFTSGGSEANTLALMGHHFSRPDSRLLTSRVEHSSLRDTASFLEKNGAAVAYVRILPTGELDWENFLELMRDFKPNLVSLMTANNETGVLFPIPDVVRVCRENEVPFHTDAVQAFGKVQPTFWGDANLVSVSAHKIHGPKGVGALLLRSGMKLVPTHYGGSQEIKRRGGTENMTGIAGFGGAAAVMAGAEAFEPIRQLRDDFEHRMLELGDVSVQGQTAPRLPNTSNLRFQGIPAEIMLGALDLEGVCVSAGSACSSGSISPSHVLLEMGLPPSEAKECVRISWGISTTAQDVETVGTLISNAVKRIRTRRGNPSLRA